MSTPTASAVTTIFRGTYQGADGEIPDASLTFKPARDIFDRRHPGFIVQNKCGVRFMSAPCGLLRADQTFVGTYLGAAGDGRIRVHIDTYGDAPLPLAEGWFDNGRLVITSGGVVSVVAIAHSLTGESGDRLVLELDKWLKATPATGDAVSFVRACDGRWATCQTLGGNFRGFPHMPATPPSNAKARKSQGPAGKK